MNKTKHHSILAAVLAAAVASSLPATAWSQGKSFIVPVPTGDAQVVLPPPPSASQPKSSATAVAAAISAARDQAGLPSASPAPKAKASGPDRTSDLIARSPSAPSAGVSIAAGAQLQHGNASPAAAAPSARPSGPTVQKKADGSQVFRTPVTPAMLQEEQRVAAATQPPAVAAYGGLPQPAPLIAQQAEGKGKSAAPPSALESFLGGPIATLPKWATDGVSKTSGKSRLVVSQGVTEMVTIARNFPNRFITPFEGAEVVTTDEGLAHDGVGGSVILSTASDKPIGIFIQDRFSDRSIGLVLMPEDVPQRELRLVLDDTWANPVLRANPDSDKAQLPTAQADYVDFVKTVLRTMAKGEVPDGHALVPVDIEQMPKCQIPGVATKPMQLLEGPTTRVAVYIASNRTAQSLPVQEGGCYRKGVLAVSAFPRAVLEPGQSTELYVLLRKESLNRAVNAKRRPVLVAE